jgi:hypothetical protein
MYDQAFYLTKRLGNNAFAYEARGESPRLYVPSLIEGRLEDVQLGNEVVFTDFDEHDVLQECLGLKHLVKTTFLGKPTVVVDNHNHVLWFWVEAGLQGAHLVHIDQHKDMRPAPEPLKDLKLETVFHYVNEVLNVGNYIQPALDIGFLRGVTLITGESHLDQPIEKEGPVILNIDLDFFAPELDYIDFDKTARFIHEQAQYADLITVASSPFFIDQSRAFDYLQRLEDWAT